MPDQQADNPGSRRVQLFMRRLRERFFLRFHMFLILTATGMVGVLASKLLLLAQMENIIVRYPLAVICSYLAFFLCVKLWLAYISASQPLSSSGITANVLPDLNMSGGSPVSSAGIPEFGGGGGGTSGGGGATGVFEGPAADAGAALQSSSGISDAGSGTGGTIGNAVSGLFDVDDDGIILIAIGVLLAAIFGVSIYLVYIAPHILSEAAFNFLLGTSLIKSYKKINHPDWIGSVFRDTYKPFICVLIIAFAAAWIIHSYAPGITKLSDFFTQ